MSQASADFIAPDARLRLWALLMLLAAAILGSVLIQWGLPALLQLIATGQIRKRWICLGFVLFVMLLVGPVLLIGSRQRGAARHIIASQQFPVAGTRVLVRTNVVRGARAVALGRFQYVIATILIVLAVALFGLTGYAAFLLLR